jgi:ferredoxin--NADP+ reductase
MDNWLEGKIIHNRQWNDRLFSLGFEAPLGEFKAGQFVRVAREIDGEVVARPYSLVNSPDEENLEIYFNVVPEGPLTPRLAQLKAGDRIMVGTKPNGLLTLEEVPRVPYLWQFATGTGVGPFLSILKTSGAWARFEKIVLVYSVRSADELAYTETIRKLAKDYPEKFCFMPCVTRERLDGAFTARITDVIENGELEARTGIVLDPDSSHVMLCGNSSMISDVRALLEGRGFRKHMRREPGHISLEKYH